MNDIDNFNSISEYYFFLTVILVWMLNEMYVELNNMFLYIKKDNLKSRGRELTSVFIMVVYSICLFLGVFFRDDVFLKHSEDLVLPHFFFYIGNAMVIMGSVIRFRAINKKKNMFNDGGIVYNPLLIKKSYGRVRYPSYLGTILCIIGITIAIRSVYSTIFNLLILFACYISLINIEERRMKKQFGTQYEECAKGVWKIIPFIW